MANTEMKNPVRVRWGHEHFRRINEFARLEDARQFAASVRKLHGATPGFDAVVERRTRPVGTNHDHWVAAE